MGHAERRKAIVQEVLRTLKEVKAKGLEIDETKLINLMGAEKGISRRTALEYLGNAKALLDDEDTA